MQINLIITVDDKTETDLLSITYLVRNYIQTIYGNDAIIDVSPADKKDCNCFDGMIIDFTTSNNEVKSQAQDISKNFLKYSKSIYRLVESSDNFIDRCRTKFTKK